MTQLLEKALSEVAKLDEPEQDALASILLDEIASEQRWTQAFAESQDVPDAVDREDSLPRLEGSVNPRRAH